MADKKKSSEPEKTEIDSGQAQPDDSTAEDTTTTGPDAIAEPGDDTAPADKADAAEDAGDTATDGAEDAVVTPEPGSEVSLDEATGAGAPDASDEAAETADDTPRSDRDGEPAAGPSRSDTPGVVPPVPPTSDPQEPRRGGVMPGLIGGLFGALIVAAGYYYLDPKADDSAARIDSLSTRVTAQADRIDQLQSTVETGPDLSGLTERLDGLTSEFDGLGNRVEGVSGDIAALGDRVTEIEKRPITESVSPEAIRAYEQELERLKAAMAQQREEVEALIDQARQMEDDANATAAATLRRAALTRILSALDNGAPYASALADLEAAGADVPDALARAAETGVASMSELRESYPDAARRALTSARASGDGGGRSLGDFLRDQLGARSLEPRAGTDADAILSRAEAALRTGRLGDALAELESLPDPARAEMSNWIENASTRHQAVTAAEDLSAALSAG